MVRAYYVFSTLLVVASKQLAAESGNQLQAYDHDVMAIDNAAVKSLPKRLLRGSQDVHDNLASEERSVYSVLASMINEGVSKMPCAAEVVERLSRTAEAAENMPQAAKAGKKMPRNAKAVEKRPRAAKAVKKLPRNAKAVEKKPRAAEAEVVKKKTRAAKDVEKMILRPKVVEEMPHAAKAIEEMRRVAKNTEELQRAAADDLLNALIGADEALKKHWKLPDTTVVIGDTSNHISKKEILSLPMWDIDFNGMRPMAVLDKHKDSIKQVYDAFVTLCDGNVKPTDAEVSILWGMMEWKDAPYLKRFYRQNLIRQAQRYVLIDFLKKKEDEMFWEEWNLLSESLRFGVLDYLLNVHFQRWVRMYNVFIQNRPDKISSPLNLELSLGGNTGTSSAMALHTHSKVPLNAASTSKVKSAALSKRSKRTFNGNTDIASPSFRQSKIRRSKSIKPLLMESTVSGDHSVSSKRTKLSLGGASSAFAPYKSGDHSVSTQNSRLSFGGTSSAFVPYKPPDVHNL